MIQEIKILCCLILYFLCIYFKTVNGLHMMQLNSYRNDRYIKWVFKNISHVFKIHEIVLNIIAIIVYFINSSIGIYVYIVILLILFFTRSKYQEKKQFVITERIKRMYFSYILLLLIISISIFVNNSFIYLLPVTYILSYLLVVFINILNSPVELYVRNKYYKQAKNKLNNIKDLKIVGITGSYGKTSTKYILNTILMQKYNVCITPESYNTTLGVVKTINENLNSTHQVFVCEMGAKQKGDIKEICDLVKPDYGILTAIGEQHLETFKSLENIIKTKCELIDALDDNGVAFLNFENENIKNLKIEKKNVKFGLSEDLDIYANNIEVSENGISFDVCVKGENSFNVTTKLLGRHNVINILGAIAIARELELKVEEIRAGIRFLKPVEHRLELKQNPNGMILIDDAYNSNQSGSTEALYVLSKFKNKKKILITPGMVELGEKTYEYNKQFGIYAAEACDYIILVGKKQTEPILAGLKVKEFSEDKIYIAHDIQDALNKMREISDQNTVVLFENDLPDNYL